MPISDETVERMRQTREATAASNMTAAEGHADLDELPAVPAEAGEVVALGVARPESPPSAKTRPPETPP